MDEAQPHLLAPAAGQDFRYSYEPLSSPKYDRAWRPSDGFRNVTRSEPRIRLLYLFPGTGPMPLECTLKVHTEPFVEDRSQPQYEAISYVWGDGKQKEDIRCDGKLLEITSSLATVLRRVRLANRTRVLWADGICIDQKDIKERAHQVMLMAAIYSHAERVLCWLGEDDEKHAEYAFGMARRISEKVKERVGDGQAEIVPDGLGDSIPGFTLNPVAKFLFSLQDFDHELQDPSNGNYITQVFRKPWFYRMWIRQEVGWSKISTLLCGDSEVDWISIDCLHKWFSLRSYQSNSQGPIEARLIFGDDFRGRSKSFLQLLIKSRAFQCSDPRDKVFALLAHPSSYGENPRVFEGLKDYTAEARKITSSHNKEAKEMVMLKAFGELLEDFNSFVREGRALPRNLLGDSPESQGERSYTAGSSEPHDGDGGTVPRENGHDSFTTYTHFMNQLRIMKEIADPRNHAAVRASSSADLTCIGSAAMIQADYSRSTTEIYRDVACTIMERSNSLQLLSAVQHDPGIGGLEETGPSWVPRWDLPQIHEYLGLNDHALTKFKPWIPPNSSDLGGGYSDDILILQGIHVDTVLCATDPLSPEIVFRKIDSMKLFKDIIAFDQSSQLTNGLHSVETYYRTLTADNLLGDIIGSMLGNLRPETLWSGFAAMWVDLYNDDQATNNVGEAGDPRIFRVPELEEEAKSGSQKDFLLMAHAVSHGRRVFYTEKGYLGLGPKALQKGDMVSILPFAVPFVLRSKDDYFLLVGECYVDGMMNGEEMDESKITQIELH